ncbi:hypothetical protein DW352_05130 [Pseudolabrys taiwanensis]|uniref:Uncharacterized protein n=1 Tax=Pseudolabrys taiwanensis TaxID=331696 RepID=A0A345ZSQ6_9HYPH|nr:hypothetical protein DW352_05130 [Pseudolabrys taiwanensis]
MVANGHHILGIQTYGNQFMISAGNYAEPLFAQHFDTRQRANSQRDALPYCGLRRPLCGDTVRMLIDPALAGPSSCNDDVLAQAGGRK